MKKQLQKYFTDGIKRGCNDVVGMEVETSFADEDGQPISLETSQTLFKSLAAMGWEITERKGRLISELRDRDGNRILYELGRQNIELSTKPSSVGKIVDECRSTLARIYESAASIGAYPLFKPILETNEDLLVVPDERDATWIKLDGRDALLPLARISAVQFTIEVPADRAIWCVNSLGKNLGAFLADYPQDSVWRQYIQNSLAGYECDRYGGPVAFVDMNDYVAKLGAYRVVTKNGLRDFTDSGAADSSIFIRSVWWYFRLRRYGDSLCIEVRPLARRTDGEFTRQLGLVLDALNL